MEVHKSNLQKISYQAETRVMSVVVSSDTEYIGDESFQEAQWKILAMIRKYLPNSLLINVQDLRYTIPPEMQEWTAKEVIPKMIEIGVRKLAYIIPQDFYAQLSIEQLADELPNFNFERRIFADEKTAMNWLLNS